MHTRSTSTLLVLVHLAGAAAAQDAQPRVATKQQYAACLDAQDAITHRSAALSKRNDDLRAFALKFQAADDNLNAQVKRHAPKTKDEVASYNRAIERRNLAAKEFNDRGKEIERDQEALNATIFRVNEQCASLLVSSEVKTEVEEERRNRGSKQ